MIVSQQIGIKQTNLQKKHLPFQVNLMSISLKKILTMRMAKKNPLSKLPFKGARISDLKVTLVRMELKRIPMTNEE